MKRLTPAALTLVMLVVVGLLVVGYVAKNLLAREAPPPSDPVLTLLMALSDLQPGTVITQGHIALGRLRESLMVPETIRSDEVVVGRVVKQPIQAARAILTTDLYPPGEFPPLDISPGMRAVAVSLDDSTSAVDGLIRPGQYVDVHFTPSSYRDQAQTGGLTMTLFKGIKVLAINRSTAGGGAGARGNNVTLELSEEQSNILIQARDKGSLTLTYAPEGKGGGGVAVGRDDRATLDEILGLDPLQEPFTSEIYYGSGRNVIQFQNGRAVGDSAINYGRSSGPASGQQPATSGASN